MRKEDEFYCGRTELKTTIEQIGHRLKNNILIPVKQEKCGTGENPHECVRGVMSNIIHGSRFRCRKCNKHFQVPESQIITITWITE